MPQVRISTALGIGASVENVLTGSQFEILPGTAEAWQIDFGITGGGTGVKADITSGTDVLMENGELDDATSWPKIPDDFTLTDLAAAGERIKIRLRNDSGAARTVRTVLVVTPRSLRG